MQRLLAFIEHNLHLIIFIILQAFCGFLLFGLSPSHQAYFSSSAAVVTANTNAFSTNVKNYFGLREQNKILQKAMIDSAYLANPYLNLRFFDDTLSITDSNNVPLYELIAAQVVYNSVHKADNVFVINKGSNHGVKKGSGILSSEGVAGIVTSVRPNFSTVMSVLNTNFKTTPRINGQEVFSELVWDSGDPYVLSIYNINKLEKLKKGDLVSTGYSSLIFPPGIPIGYIESAEVIPGSQYLDTKIKTATDFRRLNYVFVIYNLRSQEIQEVIDDEANN